MSSESPCVVRQMALGRADKLRRRKQTWLKTHTLLLNRPGLSCAESPGHDPMADKHCLKCNICTVLCTSHVIVSNDVKLERARLCVESVRV